MTAALVVAALEFDDVELRLVTGPRTNMKQVSGGTEQSMVASVDALRLRSAMAVHLDGWRRFAYQEAAEGLQTMSPRINTPGLGETFFFAHSLSRALACWDRFDHKEAWRLVEPFRSDLMERYPDLVPNLKLLTSAGERRQPAQLFDLWLNAKRRAAQGRFDDATARWYRLLEWTAQWQIKEQLGFETKAFPHDQLPSGMDLAAGDDGNVRIGLSNAWKIVAARCKGACQQFADREAQRMLAHSEKRNHSILAHGFHPVSSGAWHDLEQWTADRFLPMLREHAGLRKEPTQLPTEPPEV